MDGWLKEVGWTIKRGKGIGKKCDRDIVETRIVSKMVPFKKRCFEVFREQIVQR